MSAPEVGRRIAWREVPDRALVAVETQGGRLYALRSGSRGHYVGGPASWVGEDEEPSWSWFHGSTDGDPLVVALSVPAQASADHLRGLAKVFEVREALVIDTLDQTVGVVLKDGGERDLVVEVNSGSIVNMGALLTRAAERLHAAGWRPGMSVEDAALRLKAGHGATTSQVARLDRTKPPPGTVHDSDRRSVLVGLAEMGIVRTSPESAWVHYQRFGDPPGMWSRGGAFGLLDDPANDHPTYRRGCTLGSLASWTSAEARAAAWAWYWRRIALAQRLGTGPFAPLPCECSKPPKEWHGAGASLCQHSGELLRVLATEFWPRCLAWSDEQVAEVERWLAEGGEPPEVLR